MKKKRDLLIGNINKIVHEPARLMLLLRLKALKESSALELKACSGLSWGNLSVQLKRLEQANYIKIIKKFINKKPATTLQITKTGKNAFKEYKNKMKKVLR